MNYEIITLKEKSVVGISARTNNQSPEMGAVIGGLWGRFYNEGIYEQIEGKINDKALGIYSDYEGNEKDDYTITVACETDGNGQVPAAAKMTKIPAGKYARFVVEGPIDTVVAEFWGKLWSMGLDRSFTYDFEEYQNSDMEHAVIHIYIALK